MTTAIWKFPIIDTENQALMLPPEARILCVKDTDNTFMLYALLDVDAKPVRRVIHCFGTGDAIKKPAENLHHIDTLVRRDGLLVFHFFEERQP